MQRCAIKECINDTVEGSYCTEHATAFENIESNFKNWKKAYGEGFSYEEYLQNLTTSPKVGRNIIDVAQQLIENQST